MKSALTFQFLALFGMTVIELLFFPFIRHFALLPSFVFPIAFIYLISKKYHLVVVFLVLQFISDYIFGNHFGFESSFFCLFLFVSEMTFLYMRHFDFQNYWQKFGILYFVIHGLECLLYGSCNFLSCGIESIETILIFPFLYRLLRGNPQKVDLHVQR